MTNNNFFNLDKNKDMTPEISAEDAVVEDSDMAKSSKPKFSLFASKKTTKDSEGHSIPDNSLDDFVPGLPEVNLLPPQIKEKYASRDLLNKFIKGGIGVVALFGLIYGASFVTGLVQEKKIKEIKAEISSTQAEITSLAPIATYRQAVEGKRTALAGVTDGRVDSGKVTQSFKDSAKDAGYDISSYSLSVATDGEGMTGSCVNPDPFTPSTGIACITFSLTGDGNLKKLYTTLNDNNKGFINVYIPSATNTEEGSTLDGSVSVTSKFALADTENLTLPLDSAINGGAPTDQNTPTDGGSN